MKKFKVKLHLKSGATPKFVKARPVPFALRPKVVASLEKLEQKGVLEKVTYSEWGSPIVVVPKKTGGVRICGDYKVTLNQVSDVDQHPLPKPSDLFATLAGGKVFSKHDLTQAYHLMEVEEKLQRLLTITTHKGMLQYYARFLSKFSSELSPVHDLLKDKTPWLWTEKMSSGFPAHQTAVDICQTIMTSTCWYGWSAMHPPRAWALSSVMKCRMERIDQSHMHPGRCPNRKGIMHRLRKRHWLWFLVSRNSTTSCTPVHSHSWQTTSHSSPFLDQRREFQH